MDDMLGVFLADFEALLGVFTLDLSSCTDAERLMALVDFPEDFDEERVADLRDDNIELFKGLEGLTGVSFKLRELRGEDFRAFLGVTLADSTVSSSENVLDILRSEEVLDGEFFDLTESPGVFFPLEVTGVLGDLPLAGVLNISPMPDKL